LRSHHLPAGVLRRSNENPSQPRKPEDIAHFNFVGCRIVCPLIVRCVRAEQENKFAAGAKAGSGACSYGSAHSPNDASEDDYAAYDAVYGTDDDINPGEYVAPHHA
jgi:hypothetical protein